MMTVINMSDSIGESISRPGTIHHLTNVYIRMFCHRFGLKLVLGVAVLLVIGISINTMTQKGILQPFSLHMYYCRLFLDKIIKTQAQKN